MNLKPVDRLDYLDAMRGIAAMMVLVGHFIAWKFPQHPLIQGLLFLFNPHDAVSFFFVLSGFVLTWSYFQQKDKNLFLNQYLVARIFRLVPGFWVAVLVGLAYYNRHNLFDWVTFRHLVLLNKQNLWLEMILIRGNNNVFLPGWTLTIEMCMSFLMPFLIVIGRHNKKLLPSLLVCSILAAPMLTQHLFLFIMGTIVASEYDFIKSATFKESKLWRLRYLLLPVAIFLFCLRWIHEIWPFGFGLTNTLSIIKLDFYQISSLSAALFIVYAMASKRVQSFLNMGWLQFYGKISYGIYLLHWVFVIAFYDYWDKSLALFGGNKIALLITGMVVVIALTTISATQLYYFVEKPCIQLGKRLISKMKPRWSLNGGPK